MIREINSLLPNTLVYDIEEYIKPEDLDIIDEGISAMLQSFDKVNLMLYVDVKGGSITSLVKEFSLGIKYWNKINKIAYIGDHKKWGKFIVLDDIFTKFKEKYFELEQINKAWDWLKES